MQADLTDIVKALNSVTDAISRLPSSSYESLSVIATGLASVVLAIATVISVRRQLADSKIQTLERREQTRIEQSLRYTERYESEQMRRSRGELAAVLLNSELAGSLTYTLCEPILDFFESLGYLHSRGLLDHGLFENDFSLPAMYWWYALREQVEKLRNDVYHDTSVYKQLQVLSEQLAEAERKYNRPLPDQNSIRRFLETEARTRSAR